MELDISLFNLKMKMVTRTLILKRQEKKTVKPRNSKIGKKINHLHNRKKIIKDFWMHHRKV